MADQLGNIAVNGVARLSFTTNAASGAPVAPSSAFEAADIRLYKDGSDVQRTSSNGITMTSPFDSITGGHHVDIDLSDNTDAGFYASGSTYEVWLVPDETVDGLAVVKVLALFTIGPPADSAGVTTLLSRISSGLFTGITSLAQWLGIMAGKQTGNATARTEIRATGAGSGTYDETTDSLEGVRDTAPGAVLTAAAADPIAANTKEVNDVALEGDGDGTPWGPV